MNISPDIYVIGGCVRDVLLNITPIDIDYVVVGATPEYMTTILNMKQVGADFPVFLDDNGNEYALARTERKSGTGYHGFVTNFDPTITLRNDQERRDLTINQLAVKVDDWEEFKETQDTSLVHDGWYGIADLKQQILRHTSPHFRDDPVRILRIARFHAKYGFRIATETKNIMEMMVNDGEVNHLVQERVWSEFQKATKLTNTMNFFWVLYQCGALQIICSGLYDVMAISGLSVRTSTLRNQPYDVRTMLLYGNMVDPLKSLTKLTAQSIVIRDVLAFKNATELIAGDINAEDVLTYLKTIKHKDLLYSISTAISVVSFQDSLVFDRIIKCANAINLVRFSSLSDDDQKLKGKMVGAALDNMKLNIISQHIGK